MIQSHTYLNVADNSGARLVQCIGILNGTKRRAAYLGDIIVVVVKKIKNNVKVKRGNIYHAIIVRVNKEFKRADGTYIKFDDNAVILLDENQQPIGTRVLGPIAREIRFKKFGKILSLAPYIL